MNEDGWIRYPRFAGSRTGCYPAKAGLVIPDLPEGYVDNKAPTVQAVGAYSLR